MSNLLGSTETLVFLAIAVASFLGVGGSFLFGGGDHDVGHDISHDHGGGDHGASIFSPQIIFTFTLGFGASAAIASASNLRLQWCILIGLGSGFVLAAAAYAFFSLAYKQQATSVIQTSTAVGRVANVLIAIPANGSGEIGLDVQGQYRTYLARSRGVDIPKGVRVKVVDNQGGDLIVEPAAN
jgi:membrane protein implicated in regulation of membrane protease activity